MNDTNIINQNLHTNMVEWKKIGEMSTVVRGKRLTKGLLSDNEIYPVFHGGIEPLGYYGNYNRLENTVMVINVGASAGSVGFSDKKFWSSDGCFCISHNDCINSKYLYFFLLGKVHYLRSQVRYAGIPTLDSSAVGKIKIPIPSLAEQNRIVGILDTFTESIENIKKQIQLRKKQYEFYRDQLLDFEDKIDFVVKPLEDIVSSNCTLTYGIVQPGNDIKGGVPVVRPVDFTNLYIKKIGLKCTSPEISKVYKRTILKGNELLFCVRGTTGIMSFATPELKGCNVTRGIVPIFFENDTTKKYIYYQLKSIKLQKIIAEKTNGTALRQINIKDLRQLPLSLPSLSEQSRIVSILDQFESSISNLEQQLSQRQKQYEYYRNKLLTFE